MAKRNKSKLYGTYYTDVSIPSIKKDLENKGFKVNTRKDQLGNTLIFIKKKCLWCGRPLPKGRSKYCSDNHRNEYYQAKRDLAKRYR